MNIVRVVMALALSSLCFLWAEDPIATIDFADGPFTITRTGATVSAPSIGDDLYDQDLIATGEGGALTIALGAATGMSGTVKISSNSSFILELDRENGQQHTQIELISGQVGLKVQKIALSPALSVATETASMGVRGTEFDVSTSDSGDLLVTCSEGEVACTDESGGTTTAVPGQAVEQPEGQRMARRAVALAEYRSFREKWAADRGAAFRRNAPQALRLMAVRYLDMLRDFQAVHQELASSGLLRKWMEDEKAGKGSTDPDLAAELGQVGPRLREARRDLSAMLRITARVRALEGVLRPDRAETGRRLRPGLTVGEFFDRFDAQMEANAQREAWLLHAWRLYRRQAAAAGVQLPPQTMGGAPLGSRAPAAAP